MKKIKIKHEIVEKTLGIPPDYQYKALHKSNFLQSNWHANKLTVIESSLPLSKKVCILDLGSGSGNFEIIYASKVKQITAVDYHKEALEFLESMLKKQKTKNVKFIHSDIRDLGKVTTLEKYDIILLVDVIEHIEKKEAVSMIKLFRKILLPGGQICVITPNYKSLWIHIEHILDHFTIVPHFGGHQHLAQYYPQNLQELFESNGYKTKNMATFNLFSFLIPIRFLSTLFSKLELFSNIQFGNLLIGVFTDEKK